MIGFIKKIRDIHARNKLSRTMTLTIGSSTIVGFARVNLKNNSGCSLIVGERSLLTSNFVFERDGAQIKVGSNTFMGGCTISCAENVKIGSNVQIAWGTTIFDHSSHSTSYLKRRTDLPDTFKGKKDWSDIKIGTVEIADDVWIGLNAIILAGVRIGEGAIVAAGSVVVKDVPKMSLVVGNPARVVKVLSE